MKKTNKQDTFHSYVGLLFKPAIIKNTTEFKGSRCKNCAPFAVLTHNNVNVLDFSSCENPEYYVRKFPRLYP